MVTQDKPLIYNEWQIIDNTAISPKASPVLISSPTPPQDFHTKAASSALSAPFSLIKSSHTPNIKPTPSVNLTDESLKVNNEKPSCDSRKPQLSALFLEITNEKEEEEKESNSRVSNNIQQDIITDSDINEKEKKKMEWTWSKTVYVALVVMACTLITYAIIACVRANSPNQPDLNCWSTHFKEEAFTPNPEPKKLSDSKLWVPPFKVKLCTPDLDPKPKKVPASKEGFELSPFWNFERNPFMCDHPDILNNDDHAWCDQLFNDVNIEPTGGLDYHKTNIEIPVLNTKQREIKEYRSHYTILRDLKVYQEKPYLWWFDKLESENCTNNLIQGVSFVPKHRHWTEWDGKEKQELKQFLDNHFQSPDAKSLFIKPGHTSNSSGVMSVMNKNEKIEINETGQLALIYDEKAFEKIVKHIEDEFYMTKDEISADKNHKAIPPSQILIRPSIIVEERIPDVIEIKCVFIFGILKQCFKIWTSEYQSKFNRDLDCVIDGQQKPDKNLSRCKNLLGLMNWHKVIPQLEQLAYKMALDWLRIDIFYISKNEFYINEYETRSGSLHTFNEHLFIALKDAWKKPKFYAKNKKMEQLTCSSKMNDALSQYIENPSFE